VVIAYIVSSANSRINSILKEIQQHKEKKIIAMLCIRRDHEWFQLGEYI
jgi:hypothetical protein